LRHCGLNTKTDVLTSDPAISELHFRFILIWPWNIGSYHSSLRWMV